jgi:predicted short-subunit dehydrogenase-like oxidoreductase (DUF2520 family)
VSIGERIAVVGTGRLARALGRTLGGRIVGFVRRAPSENEIERAALGNRVVSALSEIDGGFDTLWILTADRAIAEVAGSLAASRESWEGIVIIHSSGASPLALLEPFRQKGGTTVALHPNWGATGEEPIPAEVYWGVSTSDDAGARAAERILGLLGGRAIAVDEARRGVYHAAASAASNFSVTLYVMALALYDAAGIDLDTAEEIARRFMLESIERIVPGNPIGALTGPIVRGDRDVVRRQLEGIRQHTPELWETFQALVRLTTSLVEAGG